MNRLLAHLALFGMLASSNGIYKINEECELKKSYYNPVEKRKFDKNGNKIKLNSKGKRKSKKGKIE